MSLNIDLSIDMEKTLLVASQGEPDFSLCHSLEQQDLLQRLLRVCLDFKDSEMRPLYVKK